MKVVLPDQTELELPDGATGLDAARAIGPKLAEQAVLVRANGKVQDLRLPLEDGQPIQILTTRDTNDPDALYVLRHSTAHLLAEAVRRLYPGVKVAIGPPIENGFYYDFDFPEPIHEEDLARIEAEIAKELEEGREWSREEISREDAKARFEAEHEPYKVQLVDTAEGDISLYTQGDFTDLCRGPHLQNSKPIKALKLTGLAGAYWRGDSTQPQLTRIYGTAFYSQKDLDAHLERLEEARKRDHRVLGQRLDLFHLREHSPGSPFWHPKGMVVWNELEDVRRRENARRGYVEVKTPLLYDKSTLRHLRSLGELQGEHVLVPLERRLGEAVRDQADELPGAHAALRLRPPVSYRDLPLRYAEASTLHRNELAGTLHGLLARPPRHAGRRPHLLHARADRSGARRLPRLLRLSLRPLRTRGAIRVLDAPGRQLGSDEEWDFTEGALKSALEQQRDRVRAERGRRRLLRAEDRSAHDRRARPLLADGHDPARREHAAGDSASPIWGPTTPSIRSFVIHRALFGSLERFIGILIGALRRRLPVLARAGADPGAAGRRGPSRGRRWRSSSACARRATGSTSASPTETIGKRIRASELEKIPFTIVFGDRESEQSLAIRERGGEQTEESLADLLEKLATLDS